MTNFIDSSDVNIQDTRLTVDPQLTDHVLCVVNDAPIGDSTDCRVFIFHQVSCDWRFTCIQRGAPGKSVVHFTFSVIAMYLFKCDVNWFGRNIYGMITVTRLPQSTQNALPCRELCVYLSKARSMRSKRHLLSLFTVTNLPSAPLIKLNIRFDWCRAFSVLFS